MTEKKFSEITLKLAKVCKDGCPICTQGREKGRGFLYQLVKLERHICPMCRAYEKVYGVPAHIKIKPSQDNSTKTNLKVKI
jgi:hypothetical protein